MFYDIFKELCVKKGVSVSKACLEMGLSRSIAAKWKNTQTNPSAEVLPKIAKYFGVTTDYLLGTETEKAPTLEGERIPKREEMIAAFWGGDKDLSPEDLDAMWTDVENFAAFVAQKKRGEKKK